MSNLIHVAEGFDLPAATAAQQVYSVIARRGAGKTNAAGKLIETFLTHEIQVIVLDPASTWWSLRVLPNGKPSPFTLPVLGAEHGDVPLHPDAGTLIANTLAQSSTSAVLDLSEFTQGEQRRFVTDFAEAFFHAKRKHRRPVILVLEESAEFIPQQVGAAEARMFGAMKRIAKIGRNFGIGLLMIDHRPQELHKAVLNLTEVLLVGQLNGPQERKAITGWVQENGADRDDLVGNLPSLPIGTMQVWSPQWLKIFREVKFPLKSTFDAGHARTDDHEVSLKPVDLAGLRTAMESIEKDHQDNDPKLLKKRIAELEKQLATRPKEVATKEVYVTPPALKVRISRVVAQTTRSLTAAMESLQELAQAAEVEAPALPAKRVLPAIARRPTRTVVQNPSTDGIELRAGCVKMINAIASSRTGSMTAKQIAALTGIKVTGSTFANYKSALKTGGYIEIDGDNWSLTPLGKTLVDPNTSVPTTPKAILAFWRPKLRAGAYTLLETIIDAKTIDRDEWAAAVGIDANGSTLSNYISSLVTANLVKKAHNGTYTLGEVFTA